MFDVSGSMFGIEICIIELPKSRIDYQTSTFKPRTSKQNTS